MKRPIINNYMIKYCSYWISIYWQLFQILQLLQHFYSFFIIEDFIVKESKYFQLLKAFQRVNNQDMISI